MKMRNKSKLHDSLSLNLYLGIDVNYGHISLCNLAHYCQTRNMLERKYQVHSDDARCRFSAVYVNPETAIDKFVALFNVIKAKETNL